MYLNKVRFGSDRRIGKRYIHYKAKSPSKAKAIIYIYLIRPANNFIHFLCYILAFLLFLFLLIISIIFNDEDEKDFMDLMPTLINDLFIEVFYSDAPDSGLGSNSNSEQEASDSGHGRSSDTSTLYLPCYSTCPCCFESITDESGRCNCNNEGHVMDPMDPPIKGMGVYFTEDSSRFCCNCGDRGTVPCYDCECVFCKDCSIQNSGQPESSKVNDKYPPAGLGKMKVSHLLESKEKEVQSDPSSKGKNRES